MEPRADRSHSFGTMPSFIVAQGFVWLAIVCSRISITYEACNGMLRCCLLLPQYYATNLSSYSLANPAILDGWNRFRCVSGTHIPVPATGLQVR